MSRWKETARRVIADTLATIPEGTDPKIVRKIVSAAYPFGERKMHPYKCWLAEVKKALGPRISREEKIPQVRYDVYWVDDETTPWLRVRCDWCDNSVVGGCLQCLRSCQALAAAVTDQQFKTLRTAVMDSEPLAKLALADWLEENLGSRCGVDS